MFLKWNKTGGSGPIDIIIEQITNIENNKE